MKTILLTLIIISGLLFSSMHAGAGVPPTFAYTIHNIRTTNPGNPNQDSIILFDLYLQQLNYGQPGVDPFEFAGSQLAIYYNKSIVFPGKSLFFGYNPPANSNSDVPPFLRFPSFQVDSTYSSSIGILKASGPNASSTTNFFIQAYPGTKIGTMRLRTNGNKFNIFLPFLTPNLKFKLDQSFRSFVSYFEPYTTSDSESFPQTAVPLLDTIDNYYLDHYYYPPAIRIRAYILTEGRYNASTGWLNTKDNITAYLRTGSAPYLIVDSSTVPLDSASRSAQFIFSNAPSGNYYTEIRHFQSIAFWSSTPDDQIRDETGYGNSYLTFISNNPEVVYGSNLKDLGNGNYGMFAGDVNQDDQIDLTDILNINNDASIFLTGKVTSDLNGDRLVDLSDLLMCFNNSVNFVRVLRP